MQMGNGGSGQAAESSFDDPRDDHDNSGSLLRKIMCAAGVSAAGHDGKPLTFHIDDIPYRDHAAPRAPIAGVTRISSAGCRGPAAFIAEGRKRDDAFRRDAALAALVRCLVGLPSTFTIARLTLFGEPARSDTSRRILATLLHGSHAAVRASLQRRAEQGMAAAIAIAKADLTRQQLFDDPVFEDARQRIENDPAFRLGLEALEDVAFYA